MALAKYLVATLFLTAAAIWGAALTLPDNNLHVVICDVGQGDGILVFQGTTQMLVDAGPNDRILACLGKYLPFYDRQIEVAVITHPQLDHFGGLTAVVDRYSVLQFVSSDVGNSTPSWEELVNKIKDIPQDTVHSGDVIKIGGEVNFKIIWPPAGLSDLSYLSDLNSFSLVGRLAWGDFDILLTGDADSQIQLAQMATGLLNEVEVLKVPHHGSKTAMLDEWLAVVSPEVAVISVGKNNRYGHPRPETLAQLERVGARVLRTDMDGDIEVVSDGKKWWVK